MIKRTWHFLCETLPPQNSSVGYYTLSLANGLAQLGHEVHIWYHSKKRERPRKKYKQLVNFHPIFTSWSKEEFSKMTMYIDKSSKSSYIFLQYRPDFFGGCYNKNLNVFLQQQTKKKHVLWTMFHIPYSEYVFNLKPRNILSHFYEKQKALQINKLSHKIFIPTGAWEKPLRSLAKEINKEKLHWLPLQSTVPYIKDTRRAKNLRKAFAPDAQFLFGSFGSYYDLKHLDLLQQTIKCILTNHPERSFLLLGRGSDAFVERLKDENSNISSQLETSGELDVKALSAHVQSCDLMVQPYFQGVATNRTSIMVSLAHGKPIVTNFGKNTEFVWGKSSCVVLSPDSDVKKMKTLCDKVIYDTAYRLNLGKKAIQVYDKFFSLNSILDKILTLAKSKL